MLLLRVVLTRDNINEKLFLIYSCKKLAEVAFSRIKFNS